MSRLAKECELIDAALAYGAAQEKYSAEYDRRPPESVKRDGFTDVLFDEAQNAAVSALHKARARMETLAEALYAESRKESYCPRCNGHHEREGDAEEKCQRETQFARADHRRRGGMI